MRFEIATVPLFVCHFRDYHILFYFQDFRKQKATKKIWDETCNRVPCSCILHVQQMAWLQNWLGAVWNLRIQRLLSFQCKLILFNATTAQTVEII